MLRRLLLACSIVTVLFAPAHSHPPDENREQQAEKSKKPLGFVLPNFEGARPWTEKPVLNQESRFHFAIMTDRTGGHRPGIWMRGIHAVNLLRPEFVVSVGDLIEGYTQDVNRIEREWQEFLGFIDRLDMRFFFVAGNHDVTNPIMHRIWREKFGAEWYSFDYKGVHFVCLSSEDPQSRVGDEQLEWLAEDLKANQSARWTFVFLHKPLWTYAEREVAAGNPDPTNWKRIEELLGTRPHTVFSGHVHHYVEYDRKGMKYYHLATTGGGSRLRGRAYGEFDHVMWVTMEESGPRLAIVRLDGVMAPDAVTEKGIQRFREFLAKSALQVDPILVDSGKPFRKGTINVRLTNEFDERVEVIGNVAGLPLRGLSVEPTIKFSAEPGESNYIPLEFELSQPLPLKQFSGTTITARLRSAGPESLSAELAIPVTIDRRYFCSPVEISIDGSLSEWTIEALSTPETPLVLGASSQWQGPTDASIQFRVGRAEDKLVFSGQVQDDKVGAGDAVLFTLDMRKLERRVSDSRLGEQAYMLEVTPTDKARLLPRRGGNVVELKSEVVRTEAGYAFEVEVPVERLLPGAEADWSSFQMNVAVKDSDGEEDENCFVLWRGTRDTFNRNGNYAHFFKKEEAE